MPRSRSSVCSIARRIMPKLLNICGARPNFMKIAALVRAYAAHPSLASVLVHTGQHYDERMSALFFRELDLPEPDVNLEVGSGSHAQQTAEIMRRFEPVLLEQRPDWVVVVGDVNSTIACSLVAAKLGVRVAHVEAGLRSFDREMPEEINRLLTDQLSDLLFVTERSGVENLRREGIAPERVHLVGNVMIDTLLRHRERARRSRALEELGLDAGSYVVVTLHRPSNVDEAAPLRGIVLALQAISRTAPVVFTAHPRTHKRLGETGLLDLFGAGPRLRLVEPLGYLDFLHLTANARAVLTDSGGVQEETTILDVPCLTLRRNTERPVTLTHGTNRLVAPERDAILAAWADVEANRWRRGATPELWDGKAGERIAAILAAAS
jgi:UDP-N-acetylglucosamine 2-epimerase (non-hydrolysing)